MRHYLAVAACLALTGSIADAAPARRHGKASKAKHRAKVAPPIASDDAPAEAPAAREPDRVVAATEPSDTLDDRDELDGERTELRDAPVKVRTHAHARDWHVAIGPYLWASSVDANVSIGAANVGAGVDFIQTVQHARYGAEVLADARYGRISLSGDLMYGVVSLEGTSDVGPLMVTVNGTASSLLVDGAAGYLVAGDDDSLLSLEARAGVRYQRTAVAASVDVAGAQVAPPEAIDAGRDVLAGARVFVRPSRRFFVSSTVDMGVFGSSNSTWSASADASVRLTSHVLLSLGYRTLTIDRAHVSMVMYGPRAAVQLLF